MNAEERILVWLERADFKGDGCWHSQDTIARATGCCRRTVIRSVAQLEADGRVRVQRFARGSRRPNVYRVANWNPHKRSGVLNVLAAIREARQSECHSKRTAGLSRAQTPVARPQTRALTPRCFAVEGPTTVVARAKRIDIGARRTGVQAHGAQRRFAVPELTCPSCQELAQELDRARDLLRSQAIETSKVVDEYAGVQEANRVLGKELTNLKRGISRQARESAKAEQVERVIEHWKTHRPKTKASSFPPGGRNWQTIEKALNLMADDEDGPVRACCEAINGLHIAPFEAYGKRYMKDGQGRTLRNRLEHALGDETRIERCRGIVRRVRGDEADRVFALWQVARGTEGVLFSVLLEKLGRRGMDETPEPRFVTVDGIRAREDGK